jgi:segregation and condensation protein B
VGDYNACGWRDKRFAKEFALPDDDQNISEPEEDEDDFSLDDLGAAYARAMAESGMLPAPADADENAATDQGADPDQSGLESELGLADDSESVGGISPLSIVEAALFVGHPENHPLTSAQLAATMRGVSADEVEQIIEELNQIYDDADHAFRIHRRDAGYIFGLKEELRSVRSAFYGKIRETRLNQASIDVLALVAYQPGITSAMISDQRGKDCSAVVNQLVRRELLELRRAPQEVGRPKGTLYPTARLLNLLGLKSIDDLPQVDEVDVAPRNF